MAQDQSAYLQTENRTDRQTDRQRDNQTDGQTNRQTDWTCHADKLLDNHKQETIMNTLTRNMPGRTHCKQCMGRETAMKIVESHRV